ncbi:MAG TPA: hypothetical protein VFQ93_16230 [Casimicrobiaceae bacterium]|nr:hypothetical protein [Casimicrobiaceae bacterium]
MNALQKMVALLLSISLSAFALSAMAAKTGPTKTYALSVDTTQITYDGPDGAKTLHVPAPVFVTIKNESPPSTANSNISSFSFTVSGVTITGLGVDATDVCSSQGGICTFDSQTQTVAVTNISPPVQAKGTFTVPVMVNSCGDGNWTAQVWSGSQLNGNPFGGPVPDGTLPGTPSTHVSCGDAACNAPFAVPNSFMVSGSPTDVSGVRGKYNKDGGTCSTIAYFATNTIPANETLHFAWDMNEIGATFRYNATFQNPGAPQFAWRTDSLGPVFVDAQACLATQFSNNLPAPYGTLAQSVNSSKNKISVNVTTAPTISLPFPIIVESERMQVTAISPGNWTVMRGQGGTNAVSHTVTTATPIYVMSTPRPLLEGPFNPRQTIAGYKVGDQAHGCIDFPADTTPDHSIWGVTSTFGIIDIDDIWSLGR